MVLVGDPGCDGVPPAAKINVGQLTLPAVEDAERANARRVLARVVQSEARRYYRFASRIVPSGTWESVWDRLAFAILSANTRTDDAVRALQVFVRHGRPTVLSPNVRAALLGCRIAPTKQQYVVDLPQRQTLVDFAACRVGETWDAFRVRLMSVPGLAMTKATFAACLLYPVSADLACLDTWVLKALTLRCRFEVVSQSEYRALENEIRDLARPAGVCTNIAQWIIWDYVRGSVTDQAWFADVERTI